MQIAPAIGEFLMDCGNCANRDFGLHVKPRPLNSEFRGTARITEVICLDCGRVYKLDPHGNLGGGIYNKRPGHEGVET